MVRSFTLSLTSERCWKRVTSPSASLCGLQNARALQTRRKTFSRFLRLVVKFVEELAGRHRLEATFFITYVKYDNVTTGEARDIQYHPGNPATLAAACRQLNEVIGPHAVGSLTLTGDTWSELGVGAIFEAAPPLKYAEHVALDITTSGLRHLNVRGNFDGLITSFSRMRSLHLWLDKDILH